MRARPGVTAGIVALVLGVMTLAIPAGAQQAPPARRARLIEALARHAQSRADRNLIIADSRSRNIPLQRLAIRGMGRLEDPALAIHVYPKLDSYVPEIRMEAANALGQIAQADLGETTLTRITSELFDRLDKEHESEVVGVICRTLGRLPYRDAARVQQVEARLLSALRDQPTLEVALGVASGFESLIRKQAALSPPAPPVLARLRALTDASQGSVAGDGARVRRLALLALVEARAVDFLTLQRTIHDPDEQVRREAALAAADLVDQPRTAGLITGALRDSSPMVRYEALKTYGRRQHADGCGPTVAALTDPDVHVDLLAIDLLGQPCASIGAGDEGIAELESIAASYPASAASTVTTAALGNSNTSDAGREAGTSARGPREDSGPAGSRTSDSGPRTSDSGRPARTPDLGPRTPDVAGVTDWHRPAHALVALARRAPAQARPLLPRYANGEPWQVRMYAARAAGLLQDEEALHGLALDRDDNVRNAAIEALEEVSGHGADPLYLLALARPDYQLVRTAAQALKGSFRKEEAVSGLLDALDRITRDHRETSRDVRLALLDRLAELGTKKEARRLTPFLTDFDPAVAAKAADVLSTWTGQVVRPKTLHFVRKVDIDARTLARLRAPRARVTMSGGHSFDIALLTSEAPETVLRFVAMAEDGYYNGLTFHRVVPNFVVQGGSPGANEYAGDSGPFMRDEVGLWPHVRGAVGISTRGRDTGDAQFFIDLVDNPRLNGDYTVFGQVLTGMDVVDRIAEGDVIEKIDIFER